MTESPPDYQTEVTTQGSQNYNAVLSDARPPPIIFQPMGTQPMGAQPMGAHPMGAQPMGAQPMGAHQMGAHPMGAQPQHTTVIVNQPMAMQNSGPRPWSSGICGCCEEMSSCCLGWFCPCILACNVATDMGESCCVPCCVHGGLVAMRTKIRIQNNIHGSICDDGSTACCCGPCMLCQMSRELTFIQNIQLQNVMTISYAHPTTVQ
ncbi:cornifelin homolog A-like [Gigantopelta aegis]|uniref:cornifelin homolog A-like n=1 Tax=Gigantopelta aegis TaxID=1735272 RepID=UPI001B8890BE|nr:cornifelin homolog A-like [Gigantopelta aegis]